MRLPPNCQGDVSLTRETRGRMVCAKIKVKTCKIGLTSAAPSRQGLAMIQHPPLKWLLDQSNSRASRCWFPKLQPAVLFLMICLSCAVSSAGTSKLYPPSKDQAGALRLAQVMSTATRSEESRVGKAC